jgi:hypothetical protein
MDTAIFEKRIDSTKVHEYSFKRLHGAGDILFLLNLHEFPSSGGDFDNGGIDVQYFI